MARCGVLCVGVVSDESTLAPLLFADVETGLKYFDGTPAVEEDLIIPGACDNASSFVLMWCVREVVGVWCSG